MADNGKVIPSFNFETEKEWQDRLKTILQNDYGHMVFEQVHCKNGNNSGYVDLYVMTHPDWEYQNTFPVIAIECKLPDICSMGGLVEAAEQMARYMDPKNIYKRDGEVLQNPSICLISTPEAWHDGVLYKWGGALPKLGKNAGLECWEGMTIAFQRFLWKQKCAILLDKHFETNLNGPNGASVKYHLEPG